MEDKINTQKRAAELLLRRGVSVQIPAPLFLRLFRKKTLKLVLTAPTARTLIMISDKYLSMKIGNTDSMSIPDAFGILKNSSSKMTEIIAMAILNNPKKMWLTKILSRLLSQSLTQDTVNYLFHLIIAYGGVEDFITTIRLMESMTITKPMNLSPEEKMS